METEILNKNVMLKSSSPFLNLQIGSLVLSSDFWKTKGWMRRTGQNMRIMIKDRKFSMIVPYFPSPYTKNRELCSVISLCMKYS